MEIIEKYVLDQCQIIEENSCISVRSRIEKWVVSGTEELLVQKNAGYHRVTLCPGDWEGADKWGVKKYADVAWTQSVIDSWRRFILSTRPLSAQTSASDVQGQST